MTNVVFNATKFIFSTVRNDGYKSFKELREAFHNYTRAERNGIFVLLVLIFLIGTYKLIKNFYWDSGPSFEEISHLIEEPVKEEVVADELSLFEFDPNSVSKEEMLQLGFKEKAIKTFMNYRATGANFKTIADFERVYSISEKDIKRVGDYIRFDKHKSKSAPIKMDVSKPSIKSNIKNSEPTLLFDFDPNTVSEIDLERLGLSQRVIKTMLKFRSRGKFRKAKDVSKIYGLSDSKFEELLPYIKIKQDTKVAYGAKNQERDTSRKFVKKTVYTSKYEKDTVAYKSIDINKATNEEWQRIDGIGPTYAKMINRFRGKLGGFYSAIQIGETYGLPDSVYQKILPYVKESTPPFKIPINLILTDSLARHPYLTWKQAKVVANYRGQHGPYKGAGDFKKVRIFDTEQLERITPYLDYRVAVDTFNHGG